MKQLFLLILAVLLFSGIYAQEFNVTLQVTSPKVEGTEKKIFETLQQELYDFVNNRKWTGYQFKPEERIEGTMLITIESRSGEDFKGKMNVALRRPVYKSSYNSALLNYIDKDIEFKYVEFQPLEYSDNTFSSNLTSVIAYYLYIFLGIDGDSFARNGGTPYFEKAQNIVNNAPDGRGMAGWKAFDGLRNRYWLVENMSNSRYALIHDIYYNYYRMVMDKLYDKPKVAQGELMNVLNQLDNFNSQNPNTMINQFFFQGRATEMIQILSKADPALKVRAKEILPRVDVTNAQKYNDEIK